MQKSAVRNPVTPASNVIQFINMQNSGNINVQNVQGVNKMKKSEHNYLKQILKIAEDVTKKEPAVHVISVAHDNWCNFLKNKKKRCNCYPEIQQGVKE